MRLMLDSHALLWWMDRDGPISPEARAAVDDAFNEVVVSAATIWELGIKQAKGRLRVPDDLLVMLHAQEIDVVDVTGVHGEIASALPRHHGDPFDRMIIAQAMHDEYVLVTAARQFAAYGVPTLAAR